MWKKAGILVSKSISICMRKNIVSLLSLLITLNLFSQKTYIWCGTLVDGISNEPRKNMTIVVEKNKITAIENGFSTPGTTDKSVDLKTRTVTPGWIDMHVHFEGETKKGNLADRFTANPTDIAFESLQYAKVTLMAALLP